MKRLIISLIIVLIPLPSFAISAKDRHAVIYDTTFYDATDESSICGNVSGSLPGTVPAPYGDIFTKAAAKFNAPPAIVAAIFFAGEHASHWPDPGGPWASSTAGAQGPFQFIPSTWAAYGVDGDGDGKIDIQNLTDAAFGAAKYLAANGATNGSPDGPVGKPSVQNAIFQYNHAQWYVDQVFRAYQQFLVGGSVTGVVSCSEGLGITSDGFVFPLKANKGVIRAGSSNGSGTGIWCFTKNDNCHHDYNAADIHAPTGTVVVAARGGQVVHVGTSPARLRIKGDDGLWYYYTHLGAGTVTVKVGDTVQAGQELGQIGTAQDAEGTAPHLHFDVSPVENGFRRPGPDANKFLINPQPTLVQAYNQLPE